jgi:hypothetical protein
MARGDEADDIVVVGIIIDAHDPRRVGGAGLGKRIQADVTGKEKEDEQAPDSHIAEPTARAPARSSVGKRSAAGLRFVPGLPPALVLAVVGLLDLQHRGD